jgi:hypothetical protein
MLYPIELCVQPLKILKISNLAVEGRMVIGANGKSNDTVTALANNSKTVNTIRMEGKGKVRRPIGPPRPSKTGGG